MLKQGCSGCDAVLMNVDYGKVCRERDELKKELAAVKAERDAAVADLGQMLDNCKVCRHETSGIPGDCDGECLDCKLGCFCRDCLDGSRFEWKGFAKEETR